MIKKHKFFIVSKEIKIEYCNIISILKSGLNLLKIESYTIESNNTDLSKKTSEKKSVIQNSFLKTEENYLKKGNEKIDIYKLATKDRFFVDSMNDLKGNKKSNAYLEKDITYFSNKERNTEIDELIERNIKTKKYKKIQLSQF
ncbi:hypothetical protein DMUE_1374 [Dictyocoela muelleri]|nr:hypothetical protein DMUE_1374 [Dictyocoela muelleri]